MSERIYACLLRLFPSAFRGRYEEEALRLVRDRLSNEKGFFRRLRLCLDLITDVIGALPQAYRNSYAGVAAIASITPHLDGIPSFRSLRNEPIRRGTFVVAGVLTLTSLVTFGYVMELPLSYPAAQPNGPTSPIETVLERLNKTASSDLADNVRSQTSHSAEAAVSRPENRPMPATYSALAPGTRFVASEARQPVQPSESNPSSSGSDRGPSRNAAEPSSSPMGGSLQFVQSRPEAVPAGARSVIPSNTQLLVAAAADLSGKWTESSRTAGGDADIPHSFIFNQRSAVLSGTGGPDSADQYPITHGVVAGDSVRFELNHRRKSFLYDLKVEGEELRGTLSIRSAQNARTAAVWLERSPRK
jgi:hypothetical protein